MLFGLLLTMPTYEALEWISFKTNQYNFIVALKVGRSVLNFYATRNFLREC